MAYCIAMRRFDPLAPIFSRLFGIVYPAPAVQPVSFAPVSVAKIRMSLALVVVRVPLVEVVTEAPLLLFTEPSATPESAAPEISITMMPGLITPHVEHAAARAGATFVCVAARGRRPGLAGGVGHGEVVRAVGGFPDESDEQIAGLGRDVHGEGGESRAAGIDVVLNLHEGWH